MFDEAPQGYDRIVANCRRTGRTTRMLEEAKSLDRQGFAVYVLAGSHMEVRRLRNLLRDYPSIKVELPESLINWRWETMKLHGAWPSCRVLVDHYAIEQEFARVLHELHRYDEVVRHG